MNTKLILPKNTAKRLISFVVMMVLFFVFGPTKNASAEVDLIHFNEAAVGYSLPSIAAVDDPVPVILVKVENDANEDGVFSDGETAVVAGQIVKFRVIIKNKTDEDVTLNYFIDDEYDAEAENGSCDTLVGTVLVGNETKICVFYGKLPIGVTQITNYTSVEGEDASGDKDISEDWSLVYTVLPVEPSNTPIPPSTNTPRPTSTSIYTATITPTSTLSWPVKTLTAMAIEAEKNYTATPPVFSSPTATLVPSATAGNVDSKTATSESVLIQISNLELTATSMAISANATEGVDTSPDKEVNGFNLDTIWYFVIPAALLLFGGVLIELIRWLRSRKT